jgi:hypothetical protein
MDTGTAEHVVILRDARILRQAQERAPQDEVEFGLVTVTPSSGLE